MRKTTAQEISDLFTKYKEGNINIATLEAQVLRVAATPLREIVQQDSRMTPLHESYSKEMGI